MEIVKKKKPTAMPARTKPAMIIRQFFCRMFFESPMKRCLSL
jgi:hypothetical protein